MPLSVGEQCFVHAELAQRLASIKLTAAGSNMNGLTKNTLSFIIVDS